jgi:hypothetical protein
MSNTNDYPVELGQIKAKADIDITIERCNGGTYTINILNTAITIAGRGVKEDYGDGSYEVTATMLKKLQKDYDVVPNF